MAHSGFIARSRSALAALVCLGTLAAVLGGVGQGSAGAAEGDLVPVLLQDIRTGTGNSMEVGISLKFTQVGSNVLFLASDTTVGQEWRTTDGTPGGVSLVKDINPGTGGGVAGNAGNQLDAAVLGGSVYFAGNAGTAAGTGSELWKTDGTETGTVMVKDINPGTLSGIAGGEYRVVGSNVFFVANSGTTGAELWKSDGTEAGTVLVKDINPGSAASSAANLTNVGGTLFFSANDGVNGAELWKSDGTEAGTVLVKDVRTGSSASSPINFTVAGGTLFFTANDGVNGVELWKSDGTAGGTLMVENINPGSASAISTSFSLSPTVVAHGSTVFFAANDGVNGIELWSSDGTEAGTFLVKNINPGSANGLSNGNFLTPFGASLLFRANDGVNGTELWRSDGTEAGTVLVKDINPGLNSGTPGNFAVLGSTAYMSANDGTTAPGVGTELWKTDGTEAGTALVRDIHPTGSSNPVSLTPALGTVFFAANGGATGHEPYVLRVNFSPAAGDDSYSAVEDTPLTVGAPGVLGNDTDADGDPLSAGSASTPANGSVTLNADGSFTYTPAVDFSGTDGFTYTASDGLGGTATGTVTITVVANNAPVAVDDSYSAGENTPLTVAAPGVLGNDTDADDDTLTAGSLSTPVNGSVTLNPDGSFTYTPNAGFTGVDSFTYKANDAKVDSNVATVSITVSAVNDAPNAADDTYSAIAGTPLTVAAPGVLGNDTDGDGDGLTAGSPSDPANGSVTLNADGSFTYTTDLAGFSGTDSFTYEAFDGQGGTDTATVEITIDPDPAPTSLSVNDIFVSEGDASTTTATFTVTRSGNASDSALVKVKTTDGTAKAASDYSALGLTTVSFAPFQTTATVTVDVAGDLFFEPNETFNIKLSAPTGATISDATGKATIVNDDVPASFTVDDVSVAEGDSGTTAAAFTITRSGNTAGTSTVKYQTAGGTAAAGVDYVAVGSTTVTFDPGETTEIVTVDVVGDTSPEANETFNLKLSGATGAVISDATGKATIVNDD